jgi:hypothetical protein
MCNSTVQVPLQVRLRALQPILAGLHRVAASRHPSTNSLSSSQAQCELYSRCLSSSSFVHATRLVVFLRLGAVPNKLEAAEHLANGEKANNLCGDNADGHPLCARHAPYLVEHVDGLGGGGLDGGKERLGVLGGFCDGLQVLLDGCHVSVALVSTVCRLVELPRMGYVRWCHAALVCDELAELETDSRVVCGLGTNSWSTESSACGVIMPVALTDGIDAWSWEAQSSSA